MKIYKGDLLKSQSGDWHEVVDVKGSGYIQSTNGHTQSRNENKTDTRILIYDGQFADWKSQEDVEQLYTELKGTGVAERFAEFCKTVNADFVESGFMAHDELLQFILSEIKKA